jgi:hypothetical protein
MSRTSMRLSWLVAGLALLVSPLLATTIIPISDRQLYRRADVVVHGVVLWSEPRALANGQVETVSVIGPLEVVKGSVPGSLVLHQLGGRLPDGRFVQIWGRPEYRVGSEVVVFAIARPEGDFQTAELLLGHFEVRADERSVLFAVPARAIGKHPGVTWRHPSFLQHGIDEDTAPDQDAIDPSDVAAGPRELIGFLAYLRAGAREPFAPAFAAEGPLTPVDHLDAVPFRPAPEWGNINDSLWRYNNGATAVWTLSGTANITGGGTAEAQGAVNTWTNDPNSTINYTLGSGSSNQIQLDALSSPCGWSTCLTGGGVIGCGGPNGGGSNTWRGENYATITGGTVWLRSYCTLNGFSSVVTQAVLTHELGHTLGLGHSDQNVSPHDVCRGDEGSAQMRSTVQNFTTLGTDDQDAIRWLYGDGGNHCGGSTTPTPTLTTTRTPTRTPTLSPTGSRTPTGTPTRTPTPTPTIAPPTITALNPSPALPQPIGTSITWTATATGGVAPLQYRFWSYTASTGWIIVRDYTSSNFVVWTPPAAGQYDFAVWVKSAGSPNTFDAVRDSGFFTITSTVTISALTSSPAPPVSAFTLMTWTATAAGPGPLQYRFWTYTASTGWVIARDYSTSNSFVWQPQAGSYDVAVWVKAGGSTNAFDAVRDSGFFTVTSVANVSALTPSTSTFKAGSPVTWSATASGSPGPLRYRFWTYTAATGWVIARDYSTSNSFVWSPAQAGSYDIAVWVKVAGSANAMDAVRDSGFVTVGP